MFGLEAVKQDVQQKFAELRSALHMREKLLLRQLEVIGNSQQQLATATTEQDAQAEVQFVHDEEEQLLTAIRSFGRFKLDNINLALQDVYLKQEDYITPANDHETMYKCLQQNSLHSTLLEEEHAQQPESIVVDFSRNKSLIENNAKSMNESIINITLQEAKELIRRAKIKRETIIPPLNLEELDDELESSIAEAVSSLGHDETAINTKSSQTCLDIKKTKKSRFKPKITINNCNGIINLRNISSLTINCSNENAVSAEIPLQQQPTLIDEDEDDDNSTQYLNFASKSPATSAANMNYKAAIPADSSSADDTTPTTTTTASATSSNMSSNCSSRSQSKKQKHKTKKTQHKQTQIQSSNEQCPTQSTSSNTTTKSSSMAASTQPTTHKSKTYPSYDFIVYDNNDDDAEEDAANTNATCDFYNRLLNEIKNSIKAKSKHCIVDDSPYVISGCKSAAHNYASTNVADATCDANCNSVPHSASAAGSSRSNSSSTAEPTTQPGRRLILKNFENLKIILEANSDDESFHPVQIEQWLAEIISETDLEPMQNTDLLEHSKINSESSS